MTVDDDLIAKYLSGEASPEEAIALFDWLETPANKVRFDELESTWNRSNSSVKVRTVNKDQAWRKVQPTRNIGLIIGIAASVMLIVFVGMWMIMQGPAVPELTAVTADSTRDIAFADNSHATLYRNTSIQYPEEFHGKRREVKLVSGEAYFAVEKNPEKPFVVHAAFAEIRVVGTQFNVSIKDDDVEVAVSEGRVLVVTGTDSVYLNAGSAAMMGLNKKMITARIDPNSWAYASRRLSFKDAPVEDIIRAVEKTYGYRIVLSNDDVKFCTWTGSFDQDDSVDKIVHLLSEGLNLTVAQNGKTFTLDGGQGCPR